MRAHTDGAGRWDISRFGGWGLLGVVALAGCGGEEPARLSRNSEVDVEPAEVDVEPPPPECDGESPEGCALTGCDEGLVCDLERACRPTKCTCTYEGWYCTDDCEGGECIDDCTAVDVGDGRVVSCPEVLAPDDVETWCDNVYRSPQAPDFAVVGACGECDVSYFTPPPGATEECIPPPVP